MQTSGRGLLISVREILKFLFPNYPLVGDTGFCAIIHYIHIVFTLRYDMSFTKINNVNKRSILIIMKYSSQ